MMLGRNQFLEETPHLASALAALILGILALEAFGFYARSLEYRSIRALAADEALIDRDSPLNPVKNQGTALQQAALETGGLLPVYGSSELNLLAPYNRPFHPTILFRDCPTGFTIFPVGKAETTCVIHLQKVAALGPELQGRKVAISLTPGWFFKRLTIRPDSYGGNFSELHAGELAFHTRLSLQLREDAARRMLQFPVTLAHRPLLRFALENLADGSPLGLVCYHAALPLGILHNAIVGFQDHWRVVRYLWGHPPRTSPPTAPRGAPPPDWPTLHRQADALYRAHSNNNEFGLDNERWDILFHKQLLQARNAWSEEAFLSTLEKSQEWTDLELLLCALDELGARPLLLSMPVHGPWYDACGMTYATRRAYHEKLRALGARYHTAVVDFADHDADRSFCTDPMGHLAPGGLLHYARVLDAFYHVTSQPQRLSVSGGRR
jgi:D-alanine transfer protein